MIQDLEGATSEPSRRRHVAVLSAAVAAVSLVLLFTLVVPAELGVTPQPASPLPSASARPVLTIVSGPTVFFQSGTASRVYVPRVSVCIDAIPHPYTLVLDGMGRAIAAYSPDRTAWSVPTPPDAQVGTGYLSVSCATSDIPVPLDGLSR